MSTSNGLSKIMDEVPWELMVISQSAPKTGVSEQSMVDTQVVGRPHAAWPGARKALIGMQALLFGLMVVACDARIDAVSQHLDSLKNIFLEMESKLRP